MNRQFIAVVTGGLCGDIWMPQVKCTMPLSFNLRQRIDRFSDPRRTTFREALLAYLTECGGDFQCARFTADTMLHVEMRTRKGNVTLSHAKDWNVADLPDCDDLVDADTYSWDGQSEDE